MLTAQFMSQEQACAEKSSITIEKALIAELKDEKSDPGLNRNPGLSGDPNLSSELGFKPDRDGFSFANYGSANGYDELTPVEIKRMFGDKVCLREDGGKCVLSAPGKMWMNKINKEFGGHCLGMATLSLLIFEKIERATTFGGKDTNDLAIAGNDPLQREIAFWFAHQDVNPTKSSSVKNKPLNELLSLLSESFQSKNPDDKYTLGIFGKTVSGKTNGHSVTPIAIERTGDESYRILIYDNNYPNQTRPVNVYLGNNTWSYDMRPYSSKDPHFWIGDSKTILLAPIKAKLGLQECPFCTDSKLGTCQARPEDNASLNENSENVLKTCQIFSTGNASLLITDAKGHRLGFVNGEMVNEIPGADYVLPMEPIENGDSPIFFMPFAVEAFNVTLNGSALWQEDQNNMTVISPGYALDITNITLEPGEKDELRFAPPSRDKEASLFDYTPSDRKSPIIAVGLEEMGTSYLFKVKGLELEKGTSLALHLHQDKGYFAFYQLVPDKGSLLFENKDSNAAGVYDFYMEKINESRTQVFGHTDISIDANCIAKLYYKNWPGNSSSLPITLQCGGKNESLNLTDMTDQMPGD